MYIDAQEFKYVSNIASYITALSHNNKLFLLKFCRNEFDEMLICN